jgi:hypothetical protein
MPSSKTIGAQRPFKVLVPALQSSTDPSRGPSGNPVYKWKTFEQQYLVERPGTNRVLQSGKSPGIANRTGLLLTGSPSSPSTGVIQVVGNTFLGPTSILLGAYTLTTGEDFQVGSFVQATASLVVNATPSTSTLTINGLNLSPTGGAGRTPGANNYNNTLGTVGAIAAEIAAAINDPANAFAGTATAIAAGASVNLTAVPIGALGNALTLSSSTGTVSASGANFTGGLDDVEDTALNLAAAISALPQFSASVLGDQVSVSAEQLLNITLFSKTGASPYNFALTPGNGTLTGGDPHVGPPALV